MSETKESLTAKYGTLPGFELFKEGGSWDFTADEMPSTPTSKLSGIGSALGKAGLGVAAFAANPLAGLVVGGVTSLFQYLDKKSSERKAQKRADKMWKEQKALTEREFQYRKQIDKSREAFTREKFNEEKRAQKKVEQKIRDDRMITMANMQKNNLVDMMNRSATLKANTMNLIKGGI